MRPRGASVATGLSKQWARSRRVDITSAGFRRGGSPLGKDLPGPSHGGPLAPRPRQPRRGVNGRAGFAIAGPPQVAYISTSSSFAQEGRYGWGLGLAPGMPPGDAGRGAPPPDGADEPPPIGLEGRAMPPLPMPGEGGAMGLAGVEGIAGFAAIGAGATGFGATGAAFGATGFAITGFAIAGLAATAGLRAGALRAAGFRAAVFLAALFRAGAFLALVFLAVVLRAVARFAVDLRAPVLRAVLRAVRTVLRAVRAVFFAVLRGLFFLLVVRFFPLVLVAMASAPILLCCRTRPLTRTRTCTNHASTGPGLPSHMASQIVFFIIR
jgi:hypothetical protein